ncbi:PACE efflux transporter [Gilvimarinus polysaccharolyticus]|uniref:PACE efflux transporter n=1 Tax=Gilvimarinus polysaccharolyticus TaxID=863921 RepID=UPI000673C20A|nr:PACE efflux transporter [Gilvimarinus polysaccharolyticus]
MSTFERMGHAFLYEVLALLLTVVGLLMFTHHEVSAVLASMIAISAVAMVYNFYFNIVFDRYFPAPRAQRSLSLRLYYVALFEGGLLTLTTPLVSWVMGVSLIEAFWLDIGITLFVMVYTFAFNFIYDSAREALVTAEVTQKGGRLAYV